jgi:hypothetical protein
MTHPGGLRRLPVSLARQGRRKKLLFTERGAYSEGQAYMSLIVGKKKSLMGSWVCCSVTRVLARHWYDQWGSKRNANIA